MNRERERERETERETEVYEIATHRSCCSVVRAAETRLIPVFWHPPKISLQETLAAV